MESNEEQRFRIGSGPLRISLIPKMERGEHPNCLSLAYFLRSVVKFRRILEADFFSRLEIMTQPLKTLHEILLVILDRGL